MKISDTSAIATSIYCLDGNGNRTEVILNEPFSPVVNLEITDYSCNDNKNRLFTSGSYSFSYDNEGQLSSGYGNTYTFDYEHRLTGAGSNQYFYDGRGNRLKAIRSGVTTRYIYDAAGNLLAEADGLNNITKYYIHGLGLIAMVTSLGENYTYHFNGIGSTVAMTNQFQDVVNKYTYDAFGNITNQVEAVPQPFKFVGQYGVMTEPNGFCYMRARYYDPNVGRFISEDPIGFEGGDVNLMAYVGSNPVNVIDPIGLLDNPLAKIPSFSEAFPNSEYVAPVADIVSGGIEAGFAVSLGVASAVGLAAGPETWWIPVLYGGAAVETGSDAIDRITTGIDRLGNFPQSKPICQ